jgi:hypothetical protein
LLDSSQNGRLLPACSQVPPRPWARSPGRGRPGACMHSDEKVTFAPLRPARTRPRAGMGGAATGQTPPGARGQGTACPGSTRAPRARQIRVPGWSECRGCDSAWSRSRNFFSLPLCDRPGCHESPIACTRNPARYCCSACRQAVRNVRDRERKWRSRDTLDGCKKRAFEYQAARYRRSAQRGRTSSPVPARPPPK